MGATTSTWLDTFLFWDLVLVTVLVFTDWLLGEDNRARMRELCGLLWLHVNSLSFVGFTAKEAKALRRIARMVLGHRVLSLRFFACACSLGFLGRSALTCLIIVEDSQLAPIYVTVTLAGVFTDFASLAIALWLLGLMEKNVSLFRLLGLIIADLVAAVALCLVGPILNAVISLSLLSRLDLPWDMALAYLFWGTSFCVLMGVPSLMPTGAYLSLAILFLAAKCIRPFLQKPTELLLLRFYESDRGVLSLVAVALGVVAKLMQQFLKMR